MLCSWNEEENRFESVQDLLSCGVVSRLATESRISDALREVTIMTEEKEKEFHDSPDFDVGIRIMHLFVMDLLGRDSKAGKIWAHMTEAE